MVFRKKLLTVILIFLVQAILFAQNDSSLTFTEVMFKPAAGSTNSEFIEIFNTSAAESIDLTNFKIQYATSSADLIIETDEGTLLGPKSYAIIFEGDYDFSTGIYSGIIPSEALILKINNNAFGSSGMANDDDRTIRLLNAVDDTLEIYTYSANNSAGFSDEKINLDKNNAPGNWENSMQLNGTPGFENSVAPLDYDLSVTIINISPQNPIVGDDVNISAFIKNLGELEAQNFIVEIFNDENFDSVGQTNERLLSQSIGTLQSGDSTEVITLIENISIGSKNLIANVVLDEDENNANNTNYLTFVVMPKPSEFNDLVINEIMYSPSSGEPEWIEIYNRSNETIDVSDWSFSDVSSSAIIADSSLVLLPGDYLILTDDISILSFYDIMSEVIEVNLPSLNNSGDVLTLKDGTNRTIDSLEYLPNWGGSSGGRSLERIDADGLSSLSSNWGTSTGIAKATPGRINSVTPKNIDMSISNFFSAQQFAIINDLYTVEIEVENVGIEIVEDYQLKIYRDSNSDSLAQQNELLISYSGLGINPNQIIIYKYDVADFEIGKNLLIAEVNTDNDEFIFNDTALLEFTAVEINEIPGDLVINEIMFAPNTPEPEWIEIFNRSSKSIEVNGYQISDLTDTSKVISGSNLILPNEFVIVAKDSSILDMYDIPSKIFISSFPTLNNTTDKIKILDSLDRVIDSVEYNANWGGLNGRSLERIDPFSSSNINSNWNTSINPAGATPGIVNSVTQKDNDIILNTITTDPLFPVNGDDVKISAVLTNIGRNQALFEVALFEDANLDSAANTFIEQSSDIFLTPGAQTTFEFLFSISNLQSARAFAVKVVFTDDEDTTNNKLYKIVEPGFASGSIIINEIMFRPENSEPEWIELYNNSSYEINLKDWSISDILTTPENNIITENDLFLSPETYLIITKSFSIQNFHRIIPSFITELNFANLNNDVDGVVLIDKRGVAIDSIRYDENFNSKSGYSLERIKFDNPSNSIANWGASIDIEQSTPGRINSIVPKENDLSVASVNTIPRFPEPGDQVQIAATIGNNGIFIADNFSVEFFAGEINNMMPLSITSNLSLSQNDSITVISSESFILNDTMQIAVNINYSADEDEGNNYFENLAIPGFAPNIILINEIMYSPNEGEPEWIEFINASEDSINIKNWSVSDLLSIPTKNIIADNDIFIQPNQIFIVSPMPLFFDTLQNVLVFESDFGTLSTTDGVIIYDFRDAIIDSIKYNSDWGGSRGVSLERISFDELTDDSLNWTSSLSASGSTPGKENSIYQIPSYELHDVVINEIMFDPDSENSEFIEFLNNSDKFIEIGGWSISDENGNVNTLSSRSFILQPHEYFILAADSNIIFNYPEISGSENIVILNESNLGLVNTGEQVLLNDLFGNTIDSVFYSDDWHNKNINITKNKSLERLNPNLGSNDETNWSTSVNANGATPGRENSIFTENLAASAKISISPNPFSPDSDGFEDFAVINYNLTQSIAQLRVTVFDSKGRKVRTLANNQPSGSKGSIIFDGLDESGKPLRIGIYILFIEALNSQSGVVEEMKEVVVIARKL
jgi:hypothetical protein